MTTPIAPTTTTEPDAELAWFADVLQVDPTTAAELLDYQFAVACFPSYEGDSALVAIEMQNILDRAVFSGPPPMRRRPVGSERVTTSHEFSLTCSSAGTYVAIVTTDGERAVVRANISREDVDVLVYAEREEVREKVLDQLCALITGAASCWRGSRILFTHARRVMYRHLPPSTADGTSLPPTLAQELRRNLIVPINGYDTDHRLVDRRGVLLHGRPGTGKSWALDWVQAQVAGRATVIVATAWMLNHSMSIGALFDMAASAAPCLVVLEDLDLALSGREVSGYVSDSLGELLMFMDGPDRKRGVFVAATTNYPQALDRALTRRPGRFDRKIEVGDATVDARRSVITKVIEEIAGDPESIEAVVTRTDGWSLAEINEAGQLAVLTAHDTGEPVDLLGALDDVHRGSKGIEQSTKRPDTGYV